MSIRNTAKAILLDHGKILLNRCISNTGSLYYSLPGGGQNQYETMEEAVVRECLEETGYKVKVSRFLALYEEIITDLGLHRDYPDYTHKLFHVFLCELAETTRYTPVEPDLEQLGSEWIDLEGLDELDLYPDIILRNAKALLQNPNPVYFGSDRTAVSLCYPRQDTL